MHMGTVITLPREVTSRSAARRLITGAGDSDIVLDAARLERATAGATDELVRKLLASDPQRVIVVNAGAAFQRMLLVVHRARARPERTFLLTFQTVPAEALLRPA